MAAVSIFKMSCWESCGKWYVNDISHMSGVYAKWFTPMRILDISIDDYIQLLLKFKAVGLRYYEPTDLLSFYFTKETDAKKFCNYVNKVAKNKQYYCG